MYFMCYQHLFGVSLTDYYTNVEYVTIGMEQLNVMSKYDIFSTEVFKVSLLLAPSF